MNRRLLLMGNTKRLSDNFDRADGAIGAPWTGATWTISSNKAVNTPTAGEEIFADPGLEGTYTGGLNVNLEKAGSPTLAESADVHGGSKAQLFTPTAGADIIRESLNQTLGIWYRASLWGKRTAGATGEIYARLFDGATYRDLSPFVDAVYTQKVTTARNIVAGSWQFRIAYQSTVGPSFDTVIVDDASLKALTLSTLFATVPYKKANVITSVGITFSPTYRVQAGLILNLDSVASPAYFTLVYYNRFDGKIYVDKCVNGTYTNISATTKAYSAGAVLAATKIGTSVTVTYGGAAVGTANAVSDTGIISNLKFGMFSTGAPTQAQLDGFALVGA